MTFKSLPTEFQGISYRSRAEARWAVFFTTHRIPFDYEAEGFEMGGMRYLPDFWLPIGKVWFEVKPDAPSGIELEKARRLAVGTKRLVFIAPGAPRADIGLHVVSPSGRMKQDWKFAWAHKQGIGYICDNLWNYTMSVRVANVTADPGMYNNIGPDEDLDAAGAYRFEAWTPRRKRLW